MKPHNHNNGYCLFCEVEKLAVLLPVQGPIKDFIHQNILLAFVDEPFDDAVKKASGLYEARSFMDLTYYRDKFDEGVISKDSLAQSLDEHLADECRSERHFFENALFEYSTISDEKTLRYLARRNHISPLIVDENLALVQSAKKTRSNNPKILRPLIVQQVSRDFDYEVHQLLIRLLGSFVDQGVSLWPYINQESSFVDGVKNLAASSKLPLKPWINNKDLVKWLSKPADEAVVEMLSTMLGSKNLYTPYLQEALLAHPGWSGMVSIISKNQKALNHPCQIDLMQLVLVKIAFEYQFIKSSGISFIPIEEAHYSLLKKAPHRWDISDMLSVAWLLCKSKEKLSLNSINVLNDYFLKKVWHRALENTYYQRVSSLLAQKKIDTSLGVAKKFQAVFCIDDRECSFRRILEQESDHIETFSTPGFFGIDCFFQAFDSLPQKICPPPVSPDFLIKEQDSFAKGKTRTSNLVELAIFMSRHGANSTLLGFLSACTIGHLSLFRLLSSFFRPLKWQKSYQLNKENVPPCPIYERIDDTEQKDGLKHGYNTEEMATRVFNTLKNMGLYQNLAPMIIFFGHGSSSLNNPHFAAYDCGACSGRPGNVNARVFAAMANRADVRELVKQKGIDIPTDTHFVGAYHDTCNDRVEYFDIDLLPHEKRSLFDQFSHYALTTSKKNAKERCRKFGLVPKNITEEQALQEVFHRSRALFEPRPELGHATNGLFIVGRRARSYKINLERRALLQSYDPTIDESGTILNSILNAAVPVSAGISLDYYFSRLDPAIYGCGSKLSHNVMSLIGVGNGLDDDLRTGIPIQMTEMHDPIRLLMIIEQHEHIIEHTIYANKDIRPWIENSWLKLASLHPDKNIIRIFDPDNRSWHQIRDSEIL